MRAIDAESLLKEVHETIFESNTFPNGSKLAFWYTIESIVKDQKTVVFDTETQERIL